MVAFHEGILPPKRSAPDGERPRYKRQKVTRACDQCKRRKRRCTGDVPCSICIKDRQECTYLATYTRGKSFDPPHRVSEAVVVTSPLKRAAHRSGPEATSFVGQYQGPSSAHSFLRRAWRRFGKEDDISKTIIADTQVKQGSIFQYGDRPSPDVTASLENFPAPERTDDLLTAYFNMAAPTYRFLHQSTVKQWLAQFQAIRQNGSSVELSYPRQAIVICVMALALLYELDTAGLGSRAMYTAWLQIEALYHAAHECMKRDTGRASLESVQARLSMLQYLLSTSRPNQAWYLFGETVQLMFATGMHRNLTILGAEPCLIRSESRKRAFWVAHLVDTYLSSMLGRPTLIRDEDIDQDLPMLVDDEDLTSSTAKESLDRDCSMLAVVKHIQLTIVTKRVLRSQSLASCPTDAAAYEVAVRFNSEVQAWRAALPVYLSGAVRPSSLIPLFRRQVSVLKRAYAHATMLINRPFILSEGSSLSDTERAPLIDTCLAAAKSALDLVTQFVMEVATFSAFWNTHYVTFNALSVLYVWIIQRRIGRLPPSQEVPSELELFEAAEKVRGYLSEVTQSCAPSLRYGVVLEELQQEARLRLSKLPAVVQQPDRVQQAVAPPANTLPSVFEAVATSTDLSLSDGSWDSFNGDFPTDPNLWLQLDTFPFNEFFIE